MMNFTYQLKLYSLTCHQLSAHHYIAKQNCYEKFRSSRILPKGPPTPRVRGECFAPCFHFVIALSSLSCLPSRLQKFLKSPSLIMRTPNVLHLVIRGCRGPRLAYDAFHSSIEIEYSDLPPAVGTSLNSQAELLCKIPNPRPLPRSSRRDPLHSASEESASHHVSFP